LMHILLLVFNKIMCLLQEGSYQSTKNEADRTRFHKTY
jgi:hypothetical protein